MQNDDGVKVNLDVNEYIFLKKLEALRNEMGLPEKMPSDWVQLTIMGRQVNMSEFERKGLFSLMGLVLW